MLVGQKTDEKTSRCRWVGGLSLEGNKVQTNFLTCISATKAFRHQSLAKANFSNQCCVSFYGQAGSYIFEDTVMNPIVLRLNGNRLLMEREGRLMCGGWIMNNFSRIDCIYAIQLVCEELGETTIDQDTYEHFRNMVQESEIIASLFPDISKIKEKCGCFERAMQESMLTSAEKG
ncbi:hypothetical protein HUG15_19365 [Salicibibacter cibarius]|uniref:Uncharacterized protein n=1 Tax=Salicibibacter cibarius TaxID=2743000 RepID=A0A7T6Z662_9BACI|nr:hypothetical protein HUG15_19365 [Salicibibacter cibarius]